MDEVQIEKDNNIVCLKHKTGFNLTVCFRQCRCNCHESNFNSNKNNSQIITNNIPSNLKLNSFKTNSFSKNYNNPIQKEYNIDYYNNNKDINQNIKPKSSNKPINNNINIYKKNNTYSNFGQTYDSLNRESLQLNEENNDINNYFNQNNNQDSEEKYSNNEFIYYKKDINDSNNFIQKLHEINNKGKGLPKCSSLKDFRYYNNKFLYYDNVKTNNNQNENYKTNINIVYDTNNFIKNSKILSNNFQKNNKVLNKKASKNNLYKNNNNNKISNKNNINKNNKYNKEYATNNNLYNYYIYDQKYSSKNYKTNYNYSKDLNSDEFNIIDNNLNPLGHIVDNFVTMLRNKNSKNNMIYNNNYIFKQNYNKINNKNNYNYNILKKKEKLDNICSSNFKNNNNYLKKDYSSLENKIKNIEKKNKQNLMKKNGIKERKEEYENKYGKNKNIFIKKNNNKFQKENKKINNNNNSNNSNNRLVKNLTFNKYNEEYIYIPNQYLKNNLLDNENNYQNIQNEIYNTNNSLEQRNDYNNNDNDNINNNSEYLNIQLNLDKKNYLEKYNTNYILSNDNNFEIEKFGISIQNQENKNKLIKNLYNSINQNYEFCTTPSKINNTNDIQNPSNLSSYCPNSKNNELKNDYKILSSPSIIKSDKKNKTETVAEKVRKLINQKAKNNNNLSLSTKLNIDTNLSLSDENEIQNDYNNNINRNIAISSQSIFTIYFSYEKPTILCFDIENKTFSFQDYSDFGNFEENYRLSLNNSKNENINNDGNIFITIDTNLYIITGKNYDMLYMFDSIKKTMNKLCNLKNNHSNGTLLNYENNIICLSGEYNKKVEIYSINKNEWSDLPEMLIERSNSCSCIVNNKYSKYIFNLFGYNSPSKEYLNSIEYFDINKGDSNWRYLNYNNPKLISLNICKFFCINYEDNKIIIVGGYNGKDNKYNQKFIQIILDNAENDFGDNNVVEETERKLKDIDINKKYIFNNGYKTYFNKDNGLFYEILDNQFNCHLIESSNMVHDLFYYNC